MDPFGVKFALVRAIVGEVVVIAVLHWHWGVGARHAKYRL